MPTLHFKVDFDGVTKLLRDMWSEGSYHRAMRTLNELGLPSDIQESVIHGRAKLAQDPDGIDGVDGIVIDDVWTPRLANCAYGVYPAFDELSNLERKLQEYRAKYFVFLEFEFYKLKEKAARSFSGIELDEIRLWFSAMPDEFVATLPLNEQAFLTTFLRVGYVAEMAGYFDAQRDVDVYVAHQLELDEKPTPEQDKEMISQFGWILPDGKFYPCERTDHVWLADRLDKTEADAELAGWVKIGTDMHGKPYLYEGEKRATQKQLDAVMDWCLVHGMTYLPDWIKG